MLLQFRPAFINITSFSSSHSSHSRSKYRTYAEENTASQSGHGTSTAPNVYPSSSRNGGKRRSASWKFSIPASVSSPTSLSASHQSQTGTRQVVVYHSHSSDSNSHSHSQPTTTTPRKQAESSSVLGPDSTRRPGYRLA